MTLPPAGHVRVLSPCQRAILEGQVVCPIKGGIIAIGQCVTYQAVRNGERCFQERCQHTLNRAAFVAELRKVQGEGEAAEPQKPERPVRKKVPGKRPWKASPSSTETSTT